jgi:dTDP-4-amino-4,6-dideoxygalactose transaminase
MTGDDIGAVIAAMLDEQITRGLEVRLFEEALADFCDAKYAVACSSGTMALWLACRAAGLGPGDRCVVPANTFIATANAPRECGAEVWVGDIGRETWLLSELPPTGAEAVIAIDYAGMPCNRHDYTAYCDENDAYLIVDACHSLGGRYCGRPVGGCGSWASMTCFSFHPSKLITTGEGGAIVTDNERLFNMLRRYRDNGRPGFSGLNCHMPDINAALGRSQLKRANELLGRRRHVAHRYVSNLMGEEGVRLGRRRHVAHRYVSNLMGEEGVRLQAAPHGSVSAHHIMPIWLEPDMYDSRVVAASLLEQGIETRHMYQPIKPGNRNAEDFYQGCLVLPLFPEMTLDQVDYVCEALIAELLRQRRSK